MKHTYTTTLILLSIASIHGNAYFRQVGWVNPAPAYGHIHMAVNTDIIAKHIHKVQEGIELMKKVTTQVQHKTVQRRAASFFQRVENDLTDIQNDFNNYQVAIEEVPNTPRRTKRFIGLLVALGALSLGTLNRADLMMLHASVSNIATRQTHIIDILQEHEIQIHKVQHNVIEIKKALETVINTVEENHALAILHDGELQIVMALAELRRTVMCLQNGLEWLLMKRLPMCFLNPNQMKTSLQQLSNKAAAENMDLLSTTATAMLEYEVSMLIMNRTIHVYIHTPLWMTFQHLELLQFINAPMKMSNNIMINIVSEDKYLALGKNGRHATLSMNQFKTLQEFDGKFFTPSSLILNKHRNRTCLGAIFTLDLKMVQQVCKMTFEENVETLTKIASKKYLLHTSNPQTIEVTCKGKTTHVAVQSSDIINMESGCEVETRDHVLFAGHTVTQEEKVHQWPINWDVNTLFDLTESKLENVIHKLKQMKTTPTTVRNLHKLLSDSEDFPTHQHLNIFFTIGIGILTFTLVAIMGYLLHRYCTLKQQENNQQPLPVVVD